MLNISKHILVNLELSFTIPVREIVQNKRDPLFIFPPKGIETQKSNHLSVQKNWTIHHKILSWLREAIRRLIQQYTQPPI